MKKIYYEKKGRRYVPVAEYDSDLMDSFREGTHLIMCYPGGTSRRFDIDPNYAAMIAAGRVCEDAISSAIMKASELRLPHGTRRSPLTPEQKDAWDKLVQVFGPDVRQLEWPSVRETAEAGVKAMVDEADKLMHNPSVRQAYEHFQLMCELAKEHKNDDH